MCSILALKLAFAFLFGCSSAAFQKTHPPTTSVFFFNHQGASYGNMFHCFNFLKIVYSSSIAMTLPYWWSAVLMTLQYCSIYRSILWRLCRIDDSAVLMILPYCSVYNFSMETTLPYWGLCRVVPHHTFSAVHSFVNQWSLIDLERFSSLCGPLSLIPTNGWKQSSGEMDPSKQLGFWPNKIQLFQLEKMN